MIHLKPGLGKLEEKYLVCETGNIISEGSKAEQCDFDIHTLKKIVI